MVAVAGAGRLSCAWGAWSSSTTSTSTSYTWPSTRTCSFMVRSSLGAQRLRRRLIEAQGCYRPLCIRLCEVAIIKRPCRAHRSVGYGVCSTFAERTRTFLPRNAVTAAAITDKVSGVTSCGERAEAGAGMLCSSPTIFRSLQWNQAVLLNWTKFPFGVQSFQSLHQVSPGLGGLDHIIDKPAASRYIWSCKSMPIQFDQLIAPLHLILGGVDLPAKDDFRRTFGAHDRDFSCRPCYHPIRSQVFAAHPDVCAAISFAYYDGYLGDGRSRVGKENFCPMPNDAPVLLLHAGQKSGDIDEREQRDIESIAESYEPGHLVGGVNVECPRQHAGLVRDNTH